MQKNDGLTEKHLFEKYDRELNFLESKWKSPLRNVEREFLKKQGRSMTDFDRYALGKQLEAWDSYKKMLPEAMSQNYLGRVLPNMIDIISSVYVTSIMPAIATIQPMSELVGVVFYKTLYVDGVQTFDWLGRRAWGPAADTQLASDRVENYLIGTLAASTGGWLTVVSHLKPERTNYRRGTLHVAINDQTTGLRVIDGLTDSEGNIFGPKGLTGFADPINGDIHVEVVPDGTGHPRVGDRVLVTYGYDMEADMTKIPKATFKLTNKTIEARIFMIEGQWGLITEYALQKRFGRAMDVEVANDLRAELNAEIASVAVDMLYRNMVGKSTHAADPGTASPYEHRMMFPDVINKATMKIVANAGKGKVSYMICGADVWTALKLLPGYKALETGAELGPHVAGVLDNEITIIKANSPDLVPDNQAIAGYRGANWFEAGLVYAPYLPLFLTGTVAVGSAFQKSEGAAHAAGLECVVPGLLTCISIE